MSLQKKMYISISNSQYRWKQYVITLVKWWTSWISKWTSHIQVQIYNQWMC